MAEVVRFPPLPPLPIPPEATPDERQQVFHGIVGQLTGKMFDQDGQVSVTNTARGYRASAVDLGALQDMLGSGIDRFDMAQVRERWDDDLFTWMRRAIFATVQRCKRLQITLEDNGVRVVLETQDDRGYYRYEFDVFPGVKKA